MSLIALSIPLFFFLIGVELAVARVKRRRVYRVEDGVNSLSCGIAQQVTGIGLTAWTVGIYALLFELAPAPLDAGAPWVWVAGFVLVDLLYYGFHRASHRVNAIWATHVVHHQSEEYNLTTALRQSALQGLMSAPFFWPLALLGLPTGVFVALLALDTLYQFWIHTRLIGRLGPLEWVLNTPSHHRVHHGVDPKYIDKNYGGVLIVWDRLFGTFQAEEEEPAYGTVEPLRSWNPLWANVEGWVKIARLARRSEAPSDRLRAWLAPPEWRPASMGGPATIPGVEGRRRYEAHAPAFLAPYTIAQLAVVALAVLWLLFEGGPTAPWLVAWVLASVVAWGGLFEAKRWAGPLEIARLIALPALAYITVAEPLVAAALGAFALGSIVLRWRLELRAPAIALDPMRAPPDPR